MEEEAFWKRGPAWTEMWPPEGPLGAWDTVRGLGNWGQGSGEMEEGLAARLWAELLREAGRRG